MVKKIYLRGGFTWWNFWFFVFQLAEHVLWYMTQAKKRVAGKATTSEKSTADADEDDWNKSPIRTITWGISPE